MYFRTRIFAISILTVSAVLAIVISLSWSRIMKVELDHLDARLCIEARRMMPAHTKVKHDSHDSSHVAMLKQSSSTDSALSGRRLINDLAGKLRTSSSKQLMIFVKSREQGTLAISEGVAIQEIIARLNWNYATATAAPVSELSPASDSDRISAHCQLASFEHQQSQWRASYFHTAQVQSFIAVDIAATTTELKSTLHSTFLVVIPFSLLLGILGAWFITSNTIRPINRLHRSMDRVTQKDLNKRLPVHQEDKEFKVLIDAYNTMLDRLEISFQQSSRFTADAAHELKTPLTVLRGKLEQAVAADTPTQLDLNAILDEVGHLSAITRKLLLLSQADSCSMALHLESINITNLLEELTDDMALLSDELVLHCNIQRDLVLKGDAVLLQQLFNNLLTNVMRYSLASQAVTIQAQQADCKLVISISNACVPLSEAVRSQLFDRFYRGEPEQFQGISGSGLGLSLAREIARAHDGELTLEPSAASIFTMRLVLPIVK